MDGTTDGRPQYQSTLGDYIKGIERLETDRRGPHGHPLCVRIDGHSFSRWTRDLQRPYDERMTRAMVTTMVALVDSYHATVGYTQSDEISLVLWAPGEGSQLPHDGKYQKLVSRLASRATAMFYQAAMSEGLHESCARQAPEFDARIHPVPDLDTAAKVLLWRQLDAIKNSVQMVAQHYFSHRELHGKNGTDMRQMLQFVGIEDFDAEFPSAFTRGTWARRVTRLRELTPDELISIPVSRRPTGPIRRSAVETFDLPWLIGAQDRVALIFPGHQSSAMAAASASALAP